MKLEAPVTDLGTVEAGTVCLVRLVARGVCVVAFRHEDE